MTDIHTYFGLSYSSYLVVNRTLLQSMPEPWQEKFVDLIEELESSYPQFRDAQYQVLPGIWHLCDEVDDDVLKRFGYDFNEDADGTREYFDPEGHVAIYAFLPGTDPVPHYQRGRTRVEPAQ